MSNYAKQGLPIYEDGQVRYVPPWFSELVTQIKEREEFCVYYVRGRMFGSGKDNNKLLSLPVTQMYLRMMENLGLLTSRRIGYIKHYKHKLK